MSDPEMERVEKIIRLEVNMRDRQRSGMWGDPDPLRYFVVEYDRRGADRDEALTVLRDWATHLDEVEAFRDPPDILAIMAAMPRIKEQYASLSARARAVVERADKDGAR